MTSDPYRISSSTGSNGVPLSAMANVSATSNGSPQIGFDTTHASHWNTLHSEPSTVTAPEDVSSAPHFGQCQTFTIMIFSVRLTILIEE